MEHGVLGTRLGSFKQCLRRSDARRYTFKEAGVWRKHSENINSEIHPSSRNVCLQNQRRVLLKDSPSSNFMPDVLSGRSLTGLQSRPVLPVWGWRPDSGCSSDHWKGQNQTHLHVCVERLCWLLASFRIDQQWNILFIKLLFWCDGRFDDMVVNENPSWVDGWMWLLTFEGLWGVPSRWKLHRLKCAVRLLNWGSENRFEMIRDYQGESQDVRHCPGPCTSLSSVLGIGVLIFCLDFFFLCLKSRHYKEGGGT